MTSRDYIGLLLGAAAVVALVVLVMVAVAKADYPNGFDKIKAIIDKEGYPMAIEGLTGVEGMLPDTVTRGNSEGKILLMAGEGEKGIGVAIAIVTEENDPIMYVAIYHFSADHTTVVVDILTGQQDTISPETCNEFITQWLKLYEKSKGTNV